MKKGCFPLPCQSRSKLRDWLFRSGSVSLRRSRPPSAGFSGCLLDNCWLCRRRAILRTQATEQIVETAQIDADELCESINIDSQRFQRCHPLRYHSWADSSETIERTATMAVAVIAHSVAATSKVDDVNRVDLTKWRRNTGEDFLGHLGQSIAAILHQARQLVEHNHHLAALGQI